MTEGAEDRAQGGREETSRRRRRTALAATAWVCSVVAAGVLGAWSFAHAEPGGRYERPEPLGDAGVHRELQQEQQRADRENSGQNGSGQNQGNPSDTPSPGGTSPSDSSAPTGKPAGKSTGKPAGKTASPAVTVRFPGSSATGSARCDADGQVRVLSVIPAEGYSVDDVDHGPARAAEVELEAGDDDGHDVKALVRCADGKPRVSAVADDEDDD